MNAATLSVLSYGASGNGTTNDTGALQAALNACAAGDTVYIPAGTYNTDTLYLKPGCNVKGDRAASILMARTSRQQALLYSTGENRNSTIENLVFDMNNLADTAVKFDWQTLGAVIRYNVFKNGGNPGAIFVPSGTSNSDRNTSIDHNIFKDISQGIFSYNKLSYTNVDWNYFDTFEQGVSAGGCTDTPNGTNTTIDHNTFLLGRRMAIEVCGRSNYLSASYNYIANWRPSLNPTLERYDLCSGSYPYMCDSMAISLAVGGVGVVASHNRIYRQAGTSWGIEYTVQGTESAADDNIIRNAGIAIFDGACSEFGSANCTTTRQNITTNIACGGNATSNTNIFGGWPSSNYYYSSCSDPKFPVEDAVPSMPFSLTGAATPVNQPPMVALTSPGGGTTFPAGATIAVTGSASDPDGTVSRVEFYRNGILVSTSTAAPYGYSWANAAAGSYTLSARAIDNIGASTSCSSITVTVAAPNQAPQVSITTPVSGTTLSAPATITIGANASDADGKVAKVEFLRGTTVLATLTSAPYSFTWSNVAAGTYSLTARGTDNAGAITTSAAITVAVAAPLASTPVFFKGINLGGPAVTVEGNSWLSYNSALAAGLSVKNGNTWSGTYSFTPTPAADPGTSTVLQSAVWRPASTNGVGFSLLQTVPNGTYQVYVWSIENYKSNSRSIDLKLEGTTAATGIADLPYGTWQKYGPYLTTVSDGVLSIDVLRGTKGDPGLTGVAIYSIAPNQPPKVAVTSPASGTNVSGGATVCITVSASDPDGSVKKVEFLQGTQVLATLNGSPYSYSWTNVAPGTYALTARATDNAGAVTTSAPVSITVSALSSTAPVAPVFYRGINLNGPAVTIEGNAWLSYNSALASGLTVLNANLWAGSYSFTPSPLPDAATGTMLQSAAWRSAATNGTGFSVLQTVPNGTYQIYVWSMENYFSNYRNIDLKLEGVTVAQGLGDLPLGTWKKYGPYTTTVSDGVLNLDVLRSTKGDPGLMGVAIYSLP